MDLKMERINWYGTWTLTKRETLRFMKVYHQSIFTPVVSALIFFAIFALAIGGTSHHDKASFYNFIGYGLIIMTIIQNAFANTSSSFVLSKIMGYISDILTPPLGSIELIIAFIAGAVMRGLLVGVVATIALYPFISYSLYHPLMMIFVSLISCSLLGMLGLLCGIYSKTFDQNAIITSYLITPLSFLSGTFYSIKSLPEYLQVFNLINPFFYIVDCFRYTLTGISDANIYVGLFYLSFLNILVFSILYIALNKGWRIKQ
jgi:ABC-2 type transport system permease protein